MVNGFLMLPSYYDAIRPLPDEQRLALYDAIMDYAFGGKEPEDLPPILKGYFVLLRPNIDSSARRYSASVENGKKGGRPRKEPSEKELENPAKTQKKPSENQEKEKEKEKEIDDGESAPQAPSPPPHRLSLDYPSMTAPSMKLLRSNVRNGQSCILLSMYPSSCAICGAGCSPTRIDAKLGGG